VVGLIAGGICTEIASWRVTLYVFAIIYLAAGIVGYFTLPTDGYSLTKQERYQRLKDVDWVGGFLTVAGFTLLVFSLSDWDSSPHGWRTSYIIACLVIGVLAILLFFVYEAYWAKNPMMPMRIWRYPGFALCIGIVVCGWMCFTGDLIFYATLYFQNVQGASAILTAAYFLPQVIVGILVNIAMAFLLHRIAGQTILIVSFLAFVGASILWSFVGVHTLYWALPFPALCIVVIGADAAYNVCNLHVLSTVDHTLQSTAGGVFNTFLQLSTAVGLAISSSVVSATCPDQLNASKHELVVGYRSAFYFAIGVSGLGLLLCFFLRLGKQGAKVNEEQSTSTSL
jgi:MFS family permease